MNDKSEFAMRANGAATRAVQPARLRQAPAGSVPRRIDAHDDDSIEDAPDEHYTAPVPINRNAAAARTPAHRPVLPALVAAPRVGRPVREYTNDVFVETAGYDLLFTGPRLVNERGEEVARSPIGYAFAVFRDPEDESSVVVVVPEQYSEVDEA